MNVKIDDDEPQTKVARLDHVLHLPVYDAAGDEDVAVTNENETADEVARLDQVHLPVYDVAGHEDIAVTNDND